MDKRVLLSQVGLISLSPYCETAVIIFCDCCLQGQVSIRLCQNGMK